MKGLLGQRGARCSLAGLTLLLATLLCFLVSRAGNLPIAERFEGTIPSDLKARMDKYDEEVQARIATIEVMKLFLKAPGDDDPFVTGRRAYAVKLLGLMRAPEAVDTLLDMIDTRFADTGHEDPRRTQDKLPLVVEALTNIGKPASRRAVEYLAREKSAKRSLLYVRVIQDVEGPVLGREMVKLAAETEADANRKERLETAITLFAAK